MTDHNQNQTPGQEPEADQPAEGGRGAGQSDARAGNAESGEETGDCGDPDPFAVLEKLTAENAEYKDRMLRTLAELDNVRRRSEKAVSDAKIYGITGLAADMVVFADNLRRALASLPEELRAEDGPMRAFIEGIEVTERDFISRLKRHGIERLEPKGQKFDPNMHEALFEAPDPTVPAGTVVQVVEDGYSIGERCLRPAKVGVSRGGPKEAASG